jgi:hypothetical protein
LPPPASAFASYLFDRMTCGAPSDGHEGEVKI